MQIKLPIFENFILNVLNMNMKYKYGTINTGKTIMHISNGYGQCTPKIRWGSPRDIQIITIKL